MSDELAPVPTEAVIEPQAAKTPELGSQTPVAEKPEAKPEAPKSNSDALKAASERLKAQAAEKEKAAPKTEAKVDSKAEKQDAKPQEPKTEKPREETGKSQSQNTGEKPVAQEQKAETAAPERRVSLEAPARFNENGKKDWANTPDTVKEEVLRSHRELEEGHKKYKESADRYELVKEYDELARKNGRAGVHESLKQVVELESTLARNPVEGMKKVADHFGYNFQAIASEYLGQNPNQQIQQAHERIRELEVKLQQKEFEAKAPEIVGEFFSNNEEAKDYAEDIAFVIEQGILKDPTLENAWQYVKRFGAASHASPRISQPVIPAESAVAHTPAPALNPNGSKSVSGAPTGGINPTAKHPVPANNREALQRAMARARA